MGKICKAVVAVSATVLCGCACLSCYAGSAVSKEDVKTVKRDVAVGYFSKVSLGGSADVKFVQGSKNSARIVGAKRLVDNLEVNVKGETLVISMKGDGGGIFYGNFFQNGVEYGVTVYVSSPDLTDISVRGSGDFCMDSNLDTDALTVSVVGSGDVEMRKVVCDRASFMQKGSGDVKVQSVDCASAVLDITGSGDMDMKLLKANTAEMKLRGSGDLEASLNGVTSTTASVLGSGDIDLHFTNCGNAVCNVRGSGTISLEGYLKSLKQSVTGSGDIDTDGLRVGR